MKILQNVNEMKKMNKIYNSIAEFEKGKVINPSFCKKCDSTQYKRKHYKKSKCIVHICAICENNTWN